MRRKGTIRVALLRERDSVLNKDDDQALRDYLDKYQSRGNREVEQEEING